ncbi:MAG: sugar phosphate isomerase/epimerase [Sedimentisphaerales bacterium]|nr:sugar phosphate isomerase/epimerase [Sedimentisphaerales bacterium]
MKAPSNNPSLSRRDFLATTAASLAAAGIMGSGCMQEQKKATATSRGRIPVGLQLYSVRVDAEKDLAGTVAKVAAMNYEGVEFAGFYGHSARDIRKILDDNGLRCCGSHTPWDDLSDAKLDATIEFNQTIGNPYLVCPWLQPKQGSPRQSWLDYAKRFNELAERLRPHHMQVGYHNHAHDFAPVDGTTGWDLLAGNTSKDVIMQFDTGNALSGGGDPLVYLKRYPGRATTIHIKEYSTSNPKALIGEGDIKWAEVLELCRKGGTKWYIIEEEKEGYPPLTAVEMSIKNFKKLIR